MEMLFKICIVTMNEALQLENAPLKYIRK